MALDVDVGEEPGLRFRDLGVLQLEINGVARPVRGTRLGRVLATLLINANSRVTTDTLLDAAWGDQVTVSSAGTLETHIWRLRKLIEPARNRGDGLTYLVNDTRGYRLVLNPENADSLRFVQLGEQGDRLLASGNADRGLHRFELALGLWRGRPFEAVAHEEWASAAVARLEQIYGHVNEQHVEALLRTGAADRAVGELETLIAELPYRERLWEQLMLGLYRNGRVEESLATYHRARELLLDKLGVDPGEELRRLQQRILERDPTLTQPRAQASTLRQSDAVHPARIAAGTELETDPPPGEHPSAMAAREVHLPSRLSPLIGRKIELAQIDRLLAANRLITVVGAAGSGKTRLAIEVARAASGVAPDGVWFVDLAPVDDPAAVAGTVLSTIGIMQPVVGSPLAALRTYVRDRQILLLVDNCEHLLAGVYSLFDALLGDDSQCRVLATSREPVGIDGEVLWTLAPLPVREAGQASGEEPSASAQLFIARAISADPLLETTEDTLAEIEAICAAVDGLPLAIELAAGRIRSASLAEIRRQVSGDLAGLGRAGYTAIEHHRTIELSIQWSVRLLPEDERLAHARLSVLPGLFTVEAAQAVVVDSIAARGRSSPQDVPSLLNQLVHRSLLAAVPGSRRGDPTRFRQLATVRAHAMHALASSGETEATRDRRDQWVAELVAARPAPEAEDKTRWHETVEHNHDTVSASLQRLLQDNPDPLGVRIAGQLESYWFLQGRVSEGERWLRIALARPAASLADVVTAELTLAFILAVRGRPDRSPPLVRDALANADSMEPRLLAHQLAIIAWWMYVGDEPAHDIADAPVRALAQDDPIIAVWADCLAVKTALVTDGPAATGALAAELMGKCEHIGNIHAAWLAGRLAGRAAMVADDPHNGLRLVRRVLALHRRLGGRRTADLIAFEAAFHAMTGDFRRAAEMFGHASALAFRTGVRWPFRYGEIQTARIRAALSSEEFETAWQAGIALATSTD